MSPLTKGRIIALLLFALFASAAVIIGTYLYEAVQTGTVTLAAKGRHSFSYSESPISFVLAAGFDLLLFATCLLFSILFLTSLRDQATLSRLSATSDQKSPRLGMVLLGLAAIMALAVLLKISSA